MYKRCVHKPDGRELTLYGDAPIPVDIGAPMSGPAVRAAGAHLRWHPLRGVWVSYASHRQHRTFLPPPEFNPLAPTTDDARPTELPVGPYQVAVFENRFPTLVPGAVDAPSLSAATRAAAGACEVVVFTQDPQASLGTLPLHHIELVIEVWADRYQVLGRREEVQYVFPFENRGVEVGVTLHHPHGQIYAYPFVPPVPARELAEQRAYQEQYQRGLLEDVIAAELADKRRLIFDGDDVLAFVPIFARYAYEVWIVPRRAAGSFADLDQAERRDLARALKTVLLKFDGLWRRPFPYVMAAHQAPTDGRSHPEAHLHIEFYPPYRAEGRLKHLAGSELGAGMFTADTLPEDTAAELQRVKVSLE